jgi:hypothetical protein
MLHDIYATCIVRCESLVFHLMKFFILALFIALGCDTALAQTTVSANLLQGSPSFVDSTPRPTFYFSIAPAFRGFSSLLLTWGTGSTKDGIVVKNNLWSYTVTDINQTNNVVTSDSVNDIYSFNYYNSTSPYWGRLSFVRSWDTGDSKQDVPLKRSAPNSFQWDVVVSNTHYVGSCSCTFTQVQALLEKQGPNDPIGFQGMGNQSRFSNLMALTVLSPKSQFNGMAILF